MCAILYSIYIYIQYIYCTGTDWRLLRGAAYHCDIMTLVEQSGCCDFIDNLLISTLKAVLITAS